MSKLAVLVCAVLYILSAADADSENWENQLENPEISKAYARFYLTWKDVNEIIFDLKRKNSELYEYGHELTKPMMDERLNISNRVQAGANLIIDRLRTVIGTSEEDEVDNGLPTLYCNVSDDVSEMRSALVDKLGWDYVTGEYYVDLNTINAPRGQGRDLEWRLKVFRDNMNQSCTDDIQDESTASAAQECLRNILSKAKSDADNLKWDSWKEEMSLARDHRREILESSWIELNNELKSIGKNATSAIEEYRECAKRYDQNFGSNYTETINKRIDSIRSLDPEGSPKLVNDPHDISKSNYFSSVQVSF